VTMFRVVLANPLTTHTVLDSMLEEQLELVKEPEAVNLLDQLRSIIDQRE
jgi:hypothetical protein